jgi:predicted nucleotidyltransferase
MSIPHAHSYWRHRFVADRLALERRRIQAIKQAGRAAKALGGRWPEIQQIWLFGSVLTEGFREHSDLDLLVEGLPAEAVIEALGLAEAAGPLAVDLKRADDLPPELRSRLVRGSRALVPRARDDAS